MRTIQAKATRRAWIVAAVTDTLAALAAMAVLWLLCGVSRGDCVVAFGATWCVPCQQMRPIEEKLRGEGYDIRYVDIDVNPGWKQIYRVNRVPTFVYLCERPEGNYEAGRLVGLQSEQALRQFCQPRVLLYNVAPVANVVRGILGFPMLVGY